MQLKWTVAKFRDVAHTGISGIVQLLESNDLDVRSNAASALSDLAKRRKSPKARVSDCT